MLYLLLLFIILYTYLSWRRNDWSLMLLLFALPSYQVRFNILGIPTTLLEIMIIIVFLTWLSKNYKEIIKNIKFKIKKSKIDNLKSKVQRYPFDIEIILILIISFASIAVAGFSNTSFGIFKAYFFEPILIFILIINIFSNKTVPVSKNLEPRPLASKFNFNKIIYPLIFSSSLSLRYFSKTRDHLLSRKLPPPIKRTFPISKRPRPLPRPLNATNDQLPIYHLQQKNAFPHLCHPGGAKCNPGSRRRGFTQNQKPK